MKRDQSFILCSDCSNYVVNRDDTSPDLDKEAIQSFLERVGYVALVGPVANSSPEDFVRGNPVATAVCDACDELRIGVFAFQN